MILIIEFIKLSKNDIITYIIFFFFVEIRKMLERLLTFLLNWYRLHCQKTLNGNEIVGPYTLVKYFCVETVRGDEYFVVKRKQLAMQSKFLDDCKVMGATEAAKIMDATLAKILYDHYGPKFIKDDNLR